MSDGTGGEAAEKPIFAVIVCQGLEIQNRPRRIVPLRDGTNDVSTFTCEERNGWIHCRVPVDRSPKFSFKLDQENSENSLSKEQRKRLEKEARKDVTFFNEQRFPCPDCEKWYGSDKTKIQISCRHRVPYDTEEQMKMWDLAFPEEAING